MAERMLDPRAQFAERLMIFGNEKQRIVTEAGRAAILTRDDAVAAALDDGVNLAVGIGEGDGADVIRGAAVVGQRIQFGEQASVVGGIVAVRAGVAGRVDSGPAVE